MIRHAFHAMLIAFVAGAMLAGCKSQPEPQPPPEPPVVEPPPPPPEPPPPPPKMGVNEDGELVDVGGTIVGRTFYFEYDQARLAQSDISVLATHADFLREFRTHSVTIEGHCDERGTREYNLALGERRAQAVQNYLTSAGVQSSQIDMVSYGEERPADPGKTESAYAKNRRAVLIYR